MSFYQGRKFLPRRFRLILASVLQSVGLPFADVLGEDRRRAERGLGKPETFDFLGFTFVCGKSRRGRFLIKRKTRRHSICKANFPPCGQFLIATNLILC